MRMKDHIRVMSGEMEEGCVDAVESFVCMHDRRPYPLLSQSKEMRGKAMKK